MKFTRKFVGLVLLYVLCGTSAAVLKEPQPLPKSILTLREAEDHLTVLPEKSLDLLQSNAGLLAELPVDEQIRWHIASSQAARQVADLDALQHSLQQLLPLQNEPTFTAYQSTFLNNVGVWFRRSGHLQEARYSYQCSLDNAHQPIEKLKSILNIATVLRNEGDLKQAQELNVYARSVSQDINSDRYLATIHNNLGIIALNNQELDSAAEHFQQAMDDNRRQVRRASELLNGINLLFTFVLNDEPVMYERLYPRVERQLSAYPSAARAAYLRIVNFIGQTSPTPSVSIADQAQVTKDYLATNDAGIQTLVRPHLVDRGVPVPPPARMREYTGNWLQEVHLCDWNKYRQSRVVQHIKDELPLNNG